MELAISLEGWIGLAATLIAVTTLLVSYRLFRQGSVTLEAARRSIEANIAAEVRQLNSACRVERNRVLQSFPLHTDVIARYPVEVWKVKVDGSDLGESVNAEVVNWLVESRHESVRTWNNVGDLTDEEISDASAAVGYLNDLCQMLADGTPGHFIFQQYHQIIVYMGALTVPLIYRSQGGGRWGVRVPSLINRAAIYHQVRAIHRDTVISIRREVALAGVSAPSALETARRIELCIPLIGMDGNTGSVWYEDVPGREPSPQVDYVEFKKYYEKWTSPRMFP
jgi:hypothetical protein